MRKILFDVNVVLDVLLDRKPHVEASAIAFAAAEIGTVQGWLAAHAVTTIYYLIRQEMSAAKARQTLSSILSVFKVAAVDGTVIQEALQLACPDFEDAVTARPHARHTAITLSREIQRDFMVPRSHLFLRKRLCKSGALIERPPAALKE